MGGARLSGVHNCRRFLDRALSPEVMFPSAQRLKPAHFQILTAPLKRCSTLSTQGETALAGGTPPGSTTITKAPRGLRLPLRAPIQDLLGRMTLRAQLA